MTSFLGTLAKLKYQILRKTCPSMDFYVILISHLLAELLPLYSTSCHWSFIYLLKILNNLRFSDVFRGYIKKPLTLLRYARIQFINENILTRYTVVYGRVLRSKCNSSSWTRTLENSRTGATGENLWMLVQKFLEEKQISNKTGSANLAQFYYKNIISK